MAIRVCNRRYSDGEVIEMIGEALIAPGAYSLGLLSVTSPLIFPLLEAFPGVYLHLYHDGESDAIKRARGDKRYSGRITLVEREGNFPRYPRRVDRLQALYDFAVVGRLGERIGDMLNVWPRINIGGVMFLSGTNIIKKEVGMQVRYKDKWVVLMGCCRGATGYIASMIKNTKKIDMKHQRYGIEGIIGGETTGLLIPDGSVMIHQVRDPLGVIASSSMRAPKLNRFCAPLIGYTYDEKKDSRIRWAMHYWYYWNRIADRRAHFTYRVESLRAEWGCFCRHLGIKECEFPDLPTHRNSDKAVASYPHGLTWERLYGIDGDLTDRIRELAIDYGYDLEESETLTQEGMADQAVEVSP